jgi:hypothetical protein
MKSAGGAIVRYVIKQKFVWKISDAVVILARPFEEWESKEKKTGR